MIYLLLPAMIDPKIIPLPSPTLHIVNNSCTYGPSKTSAHVVNTPATTGPPVKPAAKTLNRLLYECEFICHIKQK